MSEFKYLSKKNCACCNIRIDTTLKRNIIRVKSENINIIMLNNIKT